MGTTGEGVVTAGGGAAGGGGEAARAKVCRDLGGKQPGVLVDDLELLLLRGFLMVPGLQELLDMGLPTSGVHRSCRLRGRCWGALAVHWLWKGSLVL